MSLKLLILFLFGLLQPFDKRFHCLHENLPALRIRPLSIPTQDRVLTKDLEIVKDPDNVREEFHELGTGLSWREDDGMKFRGWSVFEPRSGCLAEPNAQSGRIMEFGSFDDYMGASRGYIALAVRKSLIASSLSEACRSNKDSKHTPCYYANHNTFVIYMKPYNNQGLLHLNLHIPSHTSRTPTSLPTHSHAQP